MSGLEIEYSSGFSTFLSVSQPSGPMPNMVAAIVCAALVLIHLLVGLIAHKLDHLDSLRLCQVSLCGRPGMYHYRVLVKTGWRRRAGQQQTTRNKNAKSGNKILSSKCRFEFLEMVNAGGMTHQAPRHTLASTCMV